MGEVAQSTVNGLGVGVIYGLVAVATIIIFKSSGVFNFAQGSVAVMSSYVLWNMFIQAKWPLWLSLVVGMVAFALLGYVLQRVCLRPLIGQAHFSMVMLTLAFSMLIQGVCLLFWGNETYGLPGVLPSGTHTLGNVTISEYYVAGAAVSLFVFASLAVFFRFTSMGLRMRAAAEDHRLAQSVGIRVTSIFDLSWMMGFGLSFAGGIVMASISRVGTSLNDLTMKALPVVIVGGMESIPGALVGGAVLGLIEAYTSTYLTPLLNMDMANVVSYIVMFIMLLFLPNGLFGEKRRGRV